MASANPSPTSSTASSLLPCSSLGECTAIFFCDSCCSSACRIIRSGFRSLCIATIMPQSLFSRSSAISACKRCCQRGLESARPSGSAGQGSRNRVLRGEGGSTKRPPLPLPLHSGGHVEDQSHFSTVILASLWHGVVAGRTTGRALFPGIVTLLADFGDSPLKRLRWRLLEAERVGLSPAPEPAISCTFRGSTRRRRLGGDTPSSPSARRISSTAAVLGRDEHAVVGGEPLEGGRAPSTPIS
mmetsp:Transcript_138998/g.259187  ORF Transcript_138998/g.259187 Transcript_138998/m.259187 type:complete len:242 (-) Transcript_138998:33-758(-)